MSAKFRNAQITGPDFSGTNLSNSNLLGSQIGVDDLETANYCGATMSDGFAADNSTCKNN